MERIYEWDEVKAKSNFLKHGISFEEAALALDDPLSVSKQERIEHGEQRWQTLGMIGTCLLLLVAHTVQIDDVEIIRIISARRANKKERMHYEQG
jgi:uncharacterized protein